MDKQIRLNACVREVIRAIKESIDQNPCEKRNILDFSYDSGVSRNIIQKGFKMTYGYRIMEYQIKKCMQLASELLDEDRLTTQQIASKCGYRSQSNFSRAFKEIYGLTPTEWKSRVIIPPTVSK